MRLISLFLRSQLFSTHGRGGTQLRTAALSIMSSARPPNGEPRPHQPRRRPRERPRLLPQGREEGPGHDVGEKNSTALGAQTPRQHSPPTSARHLTDRRFQDLPLSKPTLRALNEVLKFDTLTHVQNATLSAILEGQDVLAKARTGTGKTVAFLLPSVETLAKSTKPPRKGDISVLILSPTRELASQIGNEAEQLLTFHKPLRADVVFGGTNIKTELRRLTSQRVDVLVATPGRLSDHLKNYNLAPQLSGLKALVLDEADRLLEVGFRSDIEEILRYLPKNRQTLLFSATLPKGVRQVAGLAMKSSYEFIDTVGEDDVDTNSHVKQYSTIVPWDQQMQYLHSLLEQHRQKPGHKVLVFFTTARMTQYAAELMASAGISVMQIHSRKSQAYRTRVSDQFRAASSGILFSSDVSARGVDYPNVTLVVQMGIPPNKEQYVHRLGRTGRAGKEGEGVLVLSPDEAFFTNNLKDLPIEALPFRPPTPASVKAVAAAIPRVDLTTVSQVYQAWMGFYLGQKMGWSKERLVKEANNFSRCLGLKQPPALAKKTVGMMGLKGVPGLRIETAPYEGPGQRQATQRQGTRSYGSTGDTESGSRPSRRAQSESQPSRRKVKPFSRSA